MIAIKYKLSFIPAITVMVCFSLFQSIPTSTSFSPHEPSSFQMGVAALPPFSHEQQLSNKPVKK